MNNDYVEVYIRDYYSCSRYLKRQFAHLNLSYDGEMLTDLFHLDNHPAMKHNPVVYYIMDVNHKVLSWALVYKSTYRYNGWNGSNIINIFTDENHPNNGYAMAIIKVIGERKKYRFQNSSTIFNNLRKG